MKFSMERSLEVLERTPTVLNQLLSGLSPEWTHQNEGGDTWTAYDVIGHLIHGDKTDWLPRVELILSNNTNKKFATFDRFAQFENSKGKSLAQLLQVFALLRKECTGQLRRLNITEDDLVKPAFIHILEKLPCNNYYQPGWRMISIIFHKSRG